MALQHWIYATLGAAAVAGAVWFAPNVMGAVSDRYRGLGNDNTRVHYDLSGADYVSLCDGFKIPQARIRGNELVRDNITVGPDGRERIKDSKGFPLDHVILEVRVNPNDLNDCELMGLQDPRPAKSK